LLPGHFTSQSHIFLDSQGLVGKGCPPARGAATPLCLLRRRAKTVPLAVGKKMRGVKGDVPEKELREPESSRAASVCSSYVGCRVEKKNLQSGGGR